MNFRKRTIGINSPEYQRIHRWVKKEQGVATHCSFDVTHESTRYDWSNKSGKYLKDLSDWQQLCRACHRKFDGITDDGRKRISEANKVNSIGNSYRAIKVVGIDKRTGEYRLFNSAREAAKSVGALPSSINNCLKGITKTSAGHYWHYAGKRG